MTFATGVAGRLYCVVFKGVAFVAVAFAGPVRGSVSSRAWLGWDYVVERV